MSLIVYDDVRHLVVEEGDKVLAGTCNRCGQCCAVNDCEHLVTDQEPVGEMYRCGIYFTRPHGCALWPRLDSTFPEGCGLHWEDKA